MAALTFLQMLQGEVARMQTLHPERTGELARATALIVHGQVLPSADDPATGAVLSSDLSKTYTVNGTCDCQAGEHGKGCKHMQAWKLYRYIQGKVEAQTPPVQDDSGNLETPPLPEAPASVNVRVTIAGREVQWTLRDSDEARLAVRLEALLARYPLPERPVVQAPASQGKDWCSTHQCQMKWNDGKDGRQGWFSHKTSDGWCKGK